MNSKRVESVLLTVTLLLGLGLAGSSSATLINGGFETTLVPVPLDSFIVTNQANVPGWNTTSPDSNIEIWDSGFAGLGSPGFPVLAFEGEQFAELNATFFATLFQDTAGITAGSVVGFQFAHRGRAGVDTMRLTITDLGVDGLLGGGDDSVLFTEAYSDGNDAWGFYTSAGESPIVALGNTVRFAYEAVAAAGSATVGNFIDAADFGVDVGIPPTSVPEPGTLLLVGLGLAVMGRRGWRR